MKQSTERLLVYIEGILLAFSLALMALMCGGCTTIMPSKQQTAILATPYEKAYACALASMSVLGGLDIHSDRQSGIMSCTMHRAIALTAHVTQAGGQSQIEVTGTPIPGYVAIGPFNEVEQYVAKVQECR